MRSHAAQLNSRGRDDCIAIAARVIENVGIADDSAVCNLSRDTRWKKIY